ncbi:MAG: GNAT family N-acetyltransferase [Chloroflexota bacterium]
MAVIARSRQSQYFGLRPMDPMKDLGRVADLIEEAFADDLDRSGQNALRELRWLSRFKPILWWMITFSPDHSDFLSGFVWEEDGRVVGNITVNKTAPGSPRWLISNVAVSKAYRGRGIGRGLMYAGLELINEYRGESVSLQVRADNTPARRLYESLNFQEISGTAYLRFKRVPKVAEVPLPAGVTLRPHRFDPADAQAAYNLATVATAPARQKEWPLRLHRFQLGITEQLSSQFSQLLGGPAAAYWVVEDDQPRFVATMNVLPGVLGRNHRLELTVHPDWRGRLEKPLISRALHHLYPWRKREIVIKPPAEHVEAIQTYLEFGCREEQTLIWMKRKM